MKINKVIVAHALAVCALLFARSCWADFGLQMYQGDSFRAGAGKTSTGDNASSVFNNPAALDKVNSSAMFIEGSYYMTSATYTDKGSTDVLGAPLTGGNGGDAGTSTLVPGFYYAQRLNNRLTYGVAVNAPFGLAVKWPADWIGRYHVIESSIETVNLNPALAYQVNNRVSIGFGLSAQYATATLSNAIDFYAVCLAGGGSTALCNTLFTAPQASDGIIKVKGDDWGYGYNLGILINLHNTHYGISYRSKIDYNLKGTAVFTNPPNASAFAPAFTNTTATVPLTLPETLSFGLTQDISPSLRVSADASWTRWSQIKQFYFEFANPAQPPLSIARNWKDTWRYALGAEYKHSSRWTYQAGIAYADSAIPDSTLDPAIPTSNAWWFTAGFIYDYSKSLSFGAGINHIKFVSREMNNISPSGDTQHGVLKSGLNVVSVRMTWRK